MIMLTTWSLQDLQIHVTHNHDFTESPSFLDMDCSIRGSHLQHHVQRLLSATKASTQPKSSI